MPKSKQDLVSTNPHKPSLSITQDLDKIKKIPEHPFVDIDKTETYTKFQQKILNYMAVGARESFQFFRQITSFLRNKRALSKFKYLVLHHLISIIKLRNNQSLKPYLLLTRRGLSKALESFWIKINFWILETHPLDVKVNLANRFFKSEALRLM